MSRFNSNKLCVVVGLALAIGIAVFLAWPSVGPTTLPGIFVLGRTNDPASGPSILFSLTNQNDSQMPYSISTPQIKSAGSWSPLAATRDSAFFLPPHQATNFAVKIPSDSDTWRVPVFYGYSPFGAERLRNKIRYNLKMNWIRLKRWETPIWINNAVFDVYIVYSPEVSVQPKIEPHPATNSDALKR
jgi:hypothetical protein